MEVISKIKHAISKRRPGHGDHNKTGHKTPHPHVSRSRSAFSLGSYQGKIHKDKYLRRSSMSLPKAKLRAECSWEDLLDSDIMFLQFRDYAYQRLAGESLSFLIATERYMLIKDHALRKNFAKRIFKLFLSDTCEEPVNIGWQQTQNIKKRLKQAPLDLYEEAHRDIMRMVRYDVFPGFQESNSPAPHIRKATLRGTLENFLLVKQQKHKTKKNDTEHPTKKRSSK
mmetsp:Transcript_17206/g.19188  ORF Transcript_17206/g.19188 Transcript_17206/m.19188 type:complete len:226 (-) Transcript_17206:98-775(-)